MNILINNTVLATQIFLSLFTIAVLISLRRQKSFGGLSIAVTQELKGLAILAIVFSHIGYFLVSDQRFLFPLTIAAGLGVNLFLFLSGYGLATSAISKPLSTWQFYRRRLLKIYIPFWLVVITFLVLDFFIGGKMYGSGYILQSLLGFFPSADLWQDLNSPLWYFTFIIFYYLLFPLVFFKKHPLVSAVVLYLVGYFIVRAEPVFLSDVIHLYKVHLIAFPLGVMIAGLASKYSGSKTQRAYLQFKEKVKKFKITKAVIYYFSLAALISVFAYLSYHSNVGTTPRLEEITSLIAGAAIIFVFLLKRVEIKLFYWFGFFSYELYLFDWPLLARFDVFYRFTPAWLATILYLGLFLAIAWGMRKLIDELKFKRK